MTRIKGILHAIQWCGIKKNRRNILKLIQEVETEEIGKVIKALRRDWKAN